VAILLLKFQFFHCFIQLSGSPPLTTSNRCETFPGPQPCNERAVVFLNGECDLPPDFFRKSTFYADFDFFAADGGANIALKYGIIPSLVLGDMDSITASNRRKLEKLSRFIVFPPEKEKSDGQLLIEYLIGQGYNDIHLFAATGGRIDQTLFNLQLLAEFPQCRVISKNEETSLIPSGTAINNRCGYRASFIPLTPSVKGLTLEGFKYELKKTEVKFGSTLTLSNVIISENARVTYNEGGLLLVIARRPEVKAVRQPARLQLIKGKRASKTL